MHILADLLYPIKAYLLVIRLRYMGCCYRGLWMVHIRVMPVLPAPSRGPYD